MFLANATGAGSEETEEGGFFENHVKQDDHVQFRLPLSRQSWRDLQRHPLQPYLECNIKAASNMLSLSTIEQIRAAVSVIVQTMNLTNTRGDDDDGGFVTTSPSVASALTLLDKFSTQKNLSISFVRCLLEKANEEEEDEEDDVDDDNEILQLQEDEDRAIREMLSVPPPPSLAPPPPPPPPSPVIPVIRSLSSSSITTEERQRPKRTCRRPRPFYETANEQVLQELLPKYVRASKTHRHRKCSECDRHPATFGFRMDDPFLCKNCVLQTSHE